MKKLTLLLLVFGAALVLVKPVCATDNEANPGGSFTVTDGATDPQTLTFKFSPSVVGQYMSNGTTTNEQWYAICTYHAGGENFYGTSSTDTVIYKKARATNETLSAADIPVTAAEETGTEASEGVEAVSSEWEGWSI
ncbi:hypothetical protein [Syntrophotalea acetylenica]|uniref:hypothetical protein n=1 Tax=Syntrophotalea acetylenica TaxID=29542 RepID=UPI002A368024|nr:hypothetical protein [Syntrophotalea acetylenica]MDY0262691.1 hypothetical protein [Syntrophotalea acetylenica]